jgi:hypothetical protein
MMGCCYLKIISLLRATVPKHCTRRRQDGKTFAMTVTVVADNQKGGSSDGRIH